MFLAQKQRIAALGLLLWLGPGLWPGFARGGGLSPGRAAAAKVMAAVPAVVRAHLPADQAWKPSGAMKDADAVILRQIRSRRLQPDGAIALRTLTEIKVLTALGAQRFTNFPIFYRSSPGPSHAGHQSGPLRPPQQAARLWAKIQAATGQGLAPVFLRLRLRRGRLVPGEVAFQGQLAYVFCHRGRPAGVQIRNGLLAFPLRFTRLPAHVPAHCGPVAPRIWGSALAVADGALLPQFIGNLDRWTPASGY